MGHRRPAVGIPAFVAAIVVTAVVVAAAIFAATPFSATVTKTVPETNTTTTTQTSTVIVTSTSFTALSLSSLDVCLNEVPQTATFGQYLNSTSQGYTVTFSNGTEDFFPLGSCPVPVVPSNYLIDSVIEANPEFVAAEHGSIYVATNACNCSWGASLSNSTGQYAILNFILYGHQQIYPCGPSNYWTFNQLGLILVTIPINYTGGLQYSNAQMQPEPGNNFYTCPTTTTAQTT